MPQNDDRNFFHPEFACGEQPCVTRDDVVVDADQNRIRKAEFLNRTGDAADLSIAVRAGIVGPRDQAIDRHPLNLDVEVIHNLLGFHNRRAKPRL
jgi:hypothetical protein